MNAIKTKQDWYQALQQLSPLKKDMIELISQMEDIEWQGCNSRNVISGKTTRISVIFPSFIASQLLQELSYSITDCKLSTFVLKMNNWLIKQSKSSLYSYWEIKSESFLNRPYPFDLDDTMGAWSALRISHKRSFLSNWPTLVRNLASIYEKNFLFRTWFVPKVKDFQAWQDIDPVVNCNALTCLANIGIQSEKSHKSLAKLLNKNTKSPYYPNGNVADFFFSRMYSVINKSNQKLYKTRKEQIRELDINDSLLNTALNIASRCLVGKTIKFFEIDHFIFLFRKRQYSNETFCLDLNTNNTCVCDSVFLTYTCALYALQLIEKQIYSSKFLYGSSKNKSKFDNDRIRLFLRQLPYEIVLQRDKKSLSRAELGRAKKISDFFDRSHLFVTKIDRYYDSRKSKIGLRKVEQIILETKIRSYAARASSLEFFETQLKLLLMSYKHRPKSTMLSQKYVVFIDQIYRLCLGITKIPCELLEGLRDCFEGLQLADDLHDWEGDLVADKNTLIVTHFRNNMSNGLQINRPNAQLRKYYWNKIYPIYSKHMFFLLKSGITKISTVLPTNSYIVQWVYEGLLILHHRDLEARASLILLSEK